ncbi:MAG: LytTR family DNA-binding domain-containing protein [Pseudomonadota bacterium]
MSDRSYKVIVVDDEAPARGRLKRLIEDFDHYTCVGEASHGLQALEQVEAHQPHIVLLDIRMPGMDGIEAARHLSELDEPPAVIFATAYNEYAVDAFDAQAIAYLMKPIRREKLARALSHATRLTTRQIDTLATEANTRAPRTHLSARMGDRLRLIPWEDIHYFQADQKYVMVGLADEEILIDDSLKSLEEEFGDLVFRVHRNALVVVRYLRALEKQPDGSQMALVGDARKPLAVSRRHVSSLRKLIKSNQR